ncbi:RidA family protein [Xenorhabdus nematophila]|uniref:RidA family protein n=1 Tax=Xenorhabdus nematophila TaxID=628 RepID=UPI0003275B41|nr:RidA family protein [Xenorhabdus nematophila]CEF29467.1 Endoribonuclease L-PSP [Xenorhabdus nematophila str. Websteri]KHD27597.1 endoribonuclease L-PSP [Xenorhabdus nematophila]MBA0018813.1 RidA family protein [Xenorhabdus nematophila]MCB4426522.1 RidA family protein [Xenorhabdus nematophila]CCW28999.1 Endoribonuclease L-PSP [Xenorhabdus nematophila F1]
MMQILQPPEWIRPKGYSNGIAARGTMIFTSGQLGWDHEEKLVSDDYVEQAIQALKNITTVLAQAGAKPVHLVRLTWYVTNREDYFLGSKKIGIAYREIIGHFPVMSAFQVASLMVSGAKIQIEATAVIPH